MFISNASIAAPAFTPAEHAVKQVRTQVPGYHRLMVGDFEVTALYDGFLSVSPQLFQPFSNKSAAELDDLIAREFSPLEADKGVNTAVICFLVNTGKNLILLDSGTDDVDIMGKNTGKLVNSMKAAGYTPEQVDILLPTHMHFDHVSGLTHDGKMVFLNATLLLAKEEKGFWLDQKMDQIPEAIRGFAQLARDAVAPYVKADRVKFYKTGEEVIPGMVSKPSPGHTPGHNGIEFTSNGQTMLIWGDLMHNHAQQMADPNIAVELDMNQDQARASREAALKDVAARKIWVAGAHLPFPGLGHVRAESNGSYTWVPVEYTPIEIDGKVQ